MINGKIYRDMIISAANSIDNAKEEINSLNIFPVPDGDTGINMSLTMQAGKKCIEDFSGSLSECSDKVAGALLRGGRGNSGVILSLFFRGMSKELKNRNDADCKTLAKAFKSGVDSAYNAVRHPTEGTILTVMRMCAEKALEISENPIEICEFFNEILVCALDTLEKTPEMLPVLKQANVVDAGGKGFLIILEGMRSVVCQGKIVEADNSEAVQEKADFRQFNTEDIKFSYCTECIVNKKIDNKPSDKDVQGFKTFIMSSGDSGVFIDDTDFIKFHIHTNDPGRILSECLKYGDLATVKVENMKEQHTSLSVKDDDSSMSAGQTPKTDTTEKKSPEKKYGFVSVAAGDGIRDVFYDLGVDNVVQGGQTMNPSTDDIVNAVNITPSEIVYVLPNNKNIYMAAKLAEEIVEDKQVIVLKTVSIPQGISAMLAFDPEADTDTNTSNMKDSMKTVKTEKMTFAARDSVFENSEIKEGQILGLVENSVTFIENSKEDCMRKLAREIKDYSYITLFYGEESDEAEAQKMADLVKSEIGEDKDILVVNGGQPVYYYIISAE